MHKPCAPYGILTLGVMLDMCDMSGTIPEHWQCQAVRRFDKMCPKGCGKGTICGVAIKVHKSFHMHEQILREKGYTRSVIKSIFLVEYIPYHSLRTCPALPAHFRQHKFHPFLNAI